jgi:hypothetical protein
VREGHQRGGESEEREPERPADDPPLPTERGGTIRAARDEQQRGATDEADGGDQVQAARDDAEGLDGCGLSARC